MPPDLIGVLDSIHPIIVLFIAGFLGGITAVIYDYYTNSLSRRSIAHLVFGIIAAMIAGLISLIPGNAGLFLTCLLAGIGGASLISQYVARTDQKTAVIAAAEEKVASLKDQERLEQAIEKLQETLQANQTPKAANPKPASSQDKGQQLVRKQEKRS